MTHANDGPNFTTKQSICFLLTLYGGWGNRELAEKRLPVGSPPFRLSLFLTQSMVKLYHTDAHVSAFLYKFPFLQPSLSRGKINYTVLVNQPTIWTCIIKYRKINPFGSKSYLRNINRFDKFRNSFHVPFVIPVLRTSKQIRSVENIVKSYLTTIANKMWN